VVVIIGAGELRAVLIAFREGGTRQLEKVSVNQPAMIVIAAGVDVLEGREKERHQERKARFYGRNATHPAIDCSER